MGQRVPGEQRRGRAGDLSLGVAMIPRTAKGAKGKLKDAPWSFGTSTGPSFLVPEPERGYLWKFEVPT